MHQVEGDAQPEEARVGQEVPGRRRRVPRHHQPVLDGEVRVDHQGPAHQQRQPRQPRGLLLGSIGMGLDHGDSFGGYERGYAPGPAAGYQKTARWGISTPGLGRHAPPLAGRGGVTCQTCDGTPVPARRPRERRSAPPRHRSSDRRAPVDPERAAHGGEVRRVRQLRGPKPYRRPIVD